MSAQPPAPAAPKTNHIGLPKADYEGAKSTLCLGCGHDVITKQIINAFYEMGLEPTRSRNSQASGAPRRPQPTS